MVDNKCNTSLIWRTKKKEKKKTITPEDYHYNTHATHLSKFNLLDNILDMVTNSC